MFFTYRMLNVFALKSIFGSTDDETESDKGESILAIFKSNDRIVKTFILKYFLFFLESILASLISVA